MAIQGLMGGTSKTDFKADPHWRFPRAGGKQPKKFNTKDALNFNNMMNDVVLPVATQLQHRSDKMLAGNSSVAGICAWHRLPKRF